MDPIISRALRISLASLTFSKHFYCSSPLTQQNLLRRGKMNAHLSSHSLPHLLLSIPISRKCHSPPLTIFNSTSDHHKPMKNKFQNIGNLQPPWLISPPPYSSSSSSSHNDLLLDSQQKESSIPISLRLLQLKKKNENLVLKSISDASELGSLGNAVWTLACSLENLQKSALPIDKEDTSIRIRRDTCYSLVWLFQRVFSNSPELAIGLNLMICDFLVWSIDKFVCDLGSVILENQMDGNVGNVCEDYQKMKRQYEHAIITETKDSMILSNYAQLLYQYEEDFDSAGDYFQLAVRTEPVDPEAMGRYALFLWQVRGDIEAAEEMFLLEFLRQHPILLWRKSSGFFLIHSMEKLKLNT